jgi:hypothetical protein
VIGLSSVLPGLREIRGPLVAGYLWLANGWLLFGGSLPERDESTLVHRVYEIGDALSVVGLAAVSAVAAYLVGSLLDSAIRVAARALAPPVRSALRWSQTRVGRLYRSPSYGTEPPDSGDFDPGDDASAAAVINALSRDSASNDERYVRGSALRGLDESSFDRLRALIDSETVGSRNRLERTAERNDLALERAPGWGRKLRVSLQGSDQAHDVPAPPTVEEVVDEFDLVRSRLSEDSEPLSLKVERLDAEADFRLAIAPPLVVMGFVLGEISPWSLCLLVVPAMLTLQAISLKRTATRELVDALRSRAGTTKLEVLLPAFRLYRERADAFSDALERSDDQSTASAESSGRVAQVEELIARGQELARDVETRAGWTELHVQMAVNEWTQRVQAVLLETAPDYLPLFIDDQGLPGPPAGVSAAPPQSREYWQWMVGNRLTRLRDIADRLKAALPGGHPDGWGRTRIFLFKDLLRGLRQDHGGLFQATTTEADREMWTRRLRELADAALTPELVAWLFEEGISEMTYGAMENLTAEEAQWLGERGLRLAELESRAHIELVPEFDPRTWRFV